MHTHRGPTRTAGSRTSGRFLLRPACTTLPGLVLTVLAASVAARAEQPPADAAAGPGPAELPRSLSDDPGLPAEERAVRRRLREIVLRQWQQVPPDEYRRRELRRNYTPAPPDVMKDRARRLAWFERAWLGMFIHWNPSSFTEHEMSFARGRLKAGDWKAIAAKWDLPLDLTQTPLELYDALPSVFDPTEFDPAATIGLARAMGAQYVVIVAKHHDGFCMFHTAQTDYNIAHTPYRRDLLKMLADECHRQGLRLGIYYSLGDWHHPAYARMETFGAYMTFMYAQWAELLTHYGTVSIFWYDGGGGRPWPYAEMARFIRTRQPDCLIRSTAFYVPDVPVACDYTASEYGTPPRPREKFSGSRPFEWCFTVTGQWNYTSVPKTRDRRVMPLRSLIARQVQAVGRGGNILPNLAPAPTGAIDAHFVELFTALGAWNRRHREALYDTRPGPVDFNVYGESTRKGQTLYLFLTKGRPASGPLEVPLYRLRSPVRSARVVGRDAELTVVGSGEMRRVVVPADALRDDVPVLAVRYDGELNVSTTVYPAPGRSRITLMPYRATCHGASLRYWIPAKSVVGWTEPDDRAVWSFHVETPGTYELLAQYGCPDGQAGSVLRIASGDQRVEVAVEGTGKRPRLITPMLGRLRFDRAGVHELTLSVVKQVPGAVVNLRRLELRLKTAKRKEVES